MPRKEQPCACKVEEGIMISLWSLFRGYKKPLSPGSIPSVCGTYLTSEVRAVQNVISIFQQSSKLRNNFLKFTLINTKRSSDFL